MLPALKPKCWLQELPAEHRISLHFPPWYQLYRTGLENCFCETCLRSWQYCNKHLTFCILAIAHVWQDCHTLRELWPTNPSRLTRGLGELERNNTAPCRAAGRETGQLGTLQTNIDLLHRVGLPHTATPCASLGLSQGPMTYMSHALRIPRIWETAHNCPDMTDKAEWKITIGHMKKRQLKLLKALSDFYHLFTETLKAKRVTLFSQPPENARNYNLRLLQHLWHTCQEYHSKSKHLPSFCNGWG